MEVLSPRRNLALGEVLSLLETQFEDAERVYQRTDVGTSQEEEDAEEDEDVGDEQKNTDDEEDDDSAQGEPVEMEASLDDTSEQAKVEELKRESCGCKLGPHGVACCSVLSKEAIILTRNNCLQMARNELDLVAMAQINALRTTAAVGSPASHDQGDFRSRAHMKFFLHGIQVCQKVLLFVRAMSRTRFKNLWDSVSNHGVVDRVHGNTRKRPHNAFSFSSIENASQFIVNTSDTHGLPLPGRLPTCEEKVVVLPSDMSKRKVYNNYKVACVQQQLKPMKKSAFLKVWQGLHPNIGTMKPATDLCFECQQFMAQILRSAHLSADEKSSRLHVAEAHLEMARAEQKLYNDQIEQCKEGISEGSTPPKMHYSFDYAQQLHFPNNPQQPGPAYFLTARKCQLFGVACEPLGTQVNYIFDESEAVGKGANATISLMHHFLEVHGMKVANLLLHADNCIGQKRTMHSSTI